MDVLQTGLSRAWIKAWLRFARKDGSKESAEFKGVALAVVFLRLLRWVHVAEYFGGGGEEEIQSHSDV